MAIQDYGTLKAIVTDWMDRIQLLDEKTVGNRSFYPIDVFCAHVESEVNRKLRTEDMATIVFNANCDAQSMILLPLNFLGMRLVTVDGVDAEYLPPEMFTKASENYCGIPLYTRVANQIHVYPEVQGDSDITMVAYVAVEPLVDDADDNWLLRKFPDVYLYGCLYEACAYVVDTENEMKWKQKFDQVIYDLIESDKEDRWSGSTMSVKNV